MAAHRFFEMNEKTRTGERTVVKLSHDDLLKVVMESAGEIAARSAVINCQECGRRFLVNNQDFHHVRRCRKGFGCNGR